MVKNDSSEKAHARAPQKPEGQLVIEPYHLLFAELHERMRAGPRVRFYPPEIRHTFWQVVLPGRYSGNGAHELLDLYLRKVEEEVACAVSRQSVQYWLYVYRRLAPRSLGEQKDPTTIIWTRAVFEAAIQKYARLKKCCKIGWSDEAENTQLFGGVLQNRDIPNDLVEKLKKELKEKRQLVPLDFGVDDLREVYRVEGLCHEIWRIMAMKRIVGKGAPIQVIPTSEEMVVDRRTEQLHRLVRIFDTRGLGPGFAVSATGTVYDGQNGGVEGTLFMPRYNADQVKARDFGTLLSSSTLSIVPDFEPNFIWNKTNLRHFYRAHHYFSEGFERKHGVTLETTLALIGAILFRAAQILTKHELHILRYWQRAYEIVSQEFLRNEIEHCLSHAIEWLGMDVSKKDIDIDKGIGFLMLTDSKQSTIDLATHGPHYVLLPVEEHTYVLDYAWIWLLLYNLFYDVKVEDQNFKGQALEQVVFDSKGPLTNKMCKASDGSSKQIDASFAVGDTLVITECKSKGKSFGFFKGDIEAIKYRTDFVREVLEEVDEKAEWLARHPIGRNYDVSEFKQILPLVITPFIEYIPSLAESYWIGDDVPRVLTPPELETRLADGTIATLAKTTANTVPITL